jgi:hypothetical protein
MVPQRYLMYTARADDNCPLKAGADDNGIAGLVIRVEPKSIICRIGQHNKPQRFSKHKESIASFGLAAFL